MSEIDIKNMVFDKFNYIQYIRTVPVSHEV